MHHCRPRERSPEIVAYTAPLRDPSCQPARNALRSEIPSMKTPPTLASQASTRYTALAIVLHWFLAAVIVVGFAIGLQMSDAPVSHALGARGDVLILLYRSAGRLGLQLGAGLSHRLPGADSTAGPGTQGQGARRPADR